jgi:myo-inositol-1(or 4)-monophosphatase
MDLDALVTEASAILDAATVPFLAGHRAHSTVRTKGDDFAGEPSTPTTRCLLAAAPGAHGQILEILRSTGEPEDY